MIGFQVHRLDRQYRPLIAIAAACHTEAHNGNGSLSRTNLIGMKAILVGRYIHPDRIIENKADC